MSTPEIERVVESFIERTKLVYFYHDEQLRKEGFNPSDTKEDVSNILREILTTHDAEVVKDVLKRADDLERECNQDGDKGTKQWMAFKGFRNGIVDTYASNLLTPKK